MVVTRVQSSATAAPDVGAATTSASSATAPLPTRPRQSPSQASNERGDCPFWSSFAVSGLLASARGEGDGHGRRAGGSPSRTDHGGGSGILLDQRSTLHAGCEACE